MHSEAGLLFYPSNQVPSKSHKVSLSSVAKPQKTHTCGLVQKKTSKNAKKVELFYIADFDGMLISVPGLSYRQLFTQFLRSRQLFKGRLMDLKMRVLCGRPLTKPRIIRFDPSGMMRIRISEAHFK